MSFSEHRVIPPPSRKQGEQSTTFRPPPIDGSFTVQQMYDWHLQHSPNHRIFVYAREDGSLRNICWAEAVIAAYTCARLMDSRIPFKEKAPVVAILSMSGSEYLLIASDTITYTTTIMGLQRSNYIVFPISPRSSAPAVARLLHEVGVQHVHVGRDAFMQDLSHEALDILGSQYPSADLPQLSPIPVFEDLFLPGWRARTNSDDLPLVSSGLVLGVFEPKTTATSPTLDNIFASAKTTNSDIVVCVPYFLEALSHEPECIHWLSTRSGVLYGRGPLNKEVGDNLTSRGVSIFVLYGTTECGVVTPVLPAKASDCWDYFEFKKFATPKMVADGPDLFEFIAAKNEFSEPSIINTSVDGTDAFATSDLFTPHPTKPGYWKIIGRIDDEIIHNTGEKARRYSLFFPEDISCLPFFEENMLNQDPHVSGAVVFGRGRHQIGVLVEPNPRFSFDPANGCKLAEFKNLIWPTVKKINHLSPQHSRLFKEMIIVTKPARPLAYTAMNTVRRQAALNDYGAEIETLYKVMEDSLTQAAILPPLEWDITSTQDFVRNAVLQTLPRPMPDNEDLLQHGCDRRYGFETPSFACYVIPPHLVSIARVALTPDDDATSRINAMHKMVQKYSKDFPTISEIRAPTLKAGKIVLVTGTTGALGCHILANLTLDETVDHIYAVNRPGTVPVTKRQQRAFVDHGLDVNMKKIINSLTHIIHNAWRANFNLGLSSFESNIRSLRTLIDLALGSQARLVFTSTLAIFINVSEDLLTEAHVNATGAQGMGYTESKWVSEELLRLAPGLRYLIFRVGQLSGGPKGTWKIKEWFPSMIQSSKVLGCLPDDEKGVSWLPVHAAAQLLVNHIDNSTSIMHLVHPNLVSWSTLACFASKELNVKLAPYTQWLEALEKSTLDAKVFPAMRMLTYYKACAKRIGLRNREAFGLPRLYMTSIQEASIPPLDENEVRNWLQYWCEVKVVNW
ncbi:hypothetical protein IW262DRAFT_1291609 [Armillaria fumosa]|nr:hypothetical protein IW262DRAFT_1291609 [Armillaria fumosa]